MLNSSERKIELCSWLLEKNGSAFHSSLKLQKFLFLYETLSALENDEEADFHSLKGYDNGPVFGTVYGDYTYRFCEFKEKCEQNTFLPINEYRAKLSSFIVSTQTKEELSDITHEFHLWNKQEDEIRKNKHIQLDISNFDAHDKDMLMIFKDMYPEDFINSMKIIEIMDKFFLISNSDYAKLSEENRNTLEELAFDLSLINPVYISLTDEGGLLVD